MTYNKYIKKYINDSASHSCIFLFDGHPCQYPGGLLVASFLPLQKKFHHRELFEQNLVEDLENVPS
jgi:hypothetical protein